MRARMMPDFNMLIYISYLPEYGRQVTLYGAKLPFEEEDDPGPRPMDHSGGSTLIP